MFETDFEINFSFSTDKIVEVIKKPKIQNIRFFPMFSSKLYKFTCFQDISKNILKFMQKLSYLI